jgi:hypothetical protein
VDLVSIMGTKAGSIRRVSNRKESYNRPSTSVINAGNCPMCYAACPKAGSSTYSQTSA